MANGCLNLFRQLQHLLTGIFRTGAHEESDGLGLIDGLGQRCGLSRVRVDHGAAGGDLGFYEGVIINLFSRNVTGDNQHGYAIAGHGGLDGVVEYYPALVTGHDHFAVARALLEDLLRVGFLEEVGANLAGRNVRCQGQHLGTIAVGIIKALDEVGIARAAGGRTHCQLAGGQRVRLGGKGCGFLIAHVDPLDRGAAHRVHDRVEGVSHEAINVLDALLF